MNKIVCIILAHNEPDFLIRTVKRISAQGVKSIIHFDKAARKSDLKKIQDAFSGNHNISIISEVRGEWGKWSLVQAELIMLRKIQDLGWTPDHVHLMSGSEYPIKRLSDMAAFLEKNSQLDFIETCNITQKRWVRGGLEIERFHYHFPFSYRYPTLKFEYYLMIL